MQKPTSIETWTQWLVHTPPTKQRSLAAVQGTAIREQLSPLEIIQSISSHLHQIDQILVLIQRLVILCLITINIPHYKGWCYDQNLIVNQKEMRSYQEKTLTNLDGGAPWGTNFFMLLQTKNISWRSYAKWNLQLQWALKRKELRVPFNISGIGECESFFKKNNASLRVWFGFPTTQVVDLKRLLNTA